MFEEFHANLISSHVILFDFMPVSSCTCTGVHSKIPYYSSYVRVAVYTSYDVLLFFSQDDDSYILPVLLRFDGQPELDEEVCLDYVSCNTTGVFVCALSVAQVFFCRLLFPCP